MSDTTESEQKEAPAEAAEPAKRSRTKLVIVAAVALFLAANAGWGAAFFLTRPATASVPQPATTSAPAEEEEEQVEADEAGPMIALEPFVVNLDDPRGAQYLRVKIEIEMKDEEAKAKLEARRAIVRDRFISALSAKRASELARREDKEALREELLDMASEVSRARALYFTEFLTQ